MMQQIFIRGWSVGSMHYLSTGWLRGDALRQPFYLAAVAEYVHYGMF
jgi:hypothetical protein